jgi:hypothetical protein
MGGGGLIQLVQIIMSDIVSLQEYVYSALSSLHLSDPFIQVAASTAVSSVRRGVLQGECCALPIEQALNCLISVA